MYWLGDLGAKTEREVAGSSPSLTCQDHILDILSIYNIPQKIISAFNLSEDQSNNKNPNRLRIDSQMIGEHNIEVLRLAHLIKEGDPDEQKFGA